tara:strand:- start:313 stop:555 length:243 start_codon:yes stop_codon:yes gene_type:complete
MEHPGFTKPSITRLARRAGVKSMSDDCVDTIRSLIGMELNEIIRMAVIMNEQNSTKTVMTDDIYNALQFLNMNVAKTDDM